MDIHTKSILSFFLMMFFLGMMYIGIRSCSKEKTYENTEKIYANKVKTSIISDSLQNINNSLVKENDSLKVLIHTKDSIINFYASAIEEQSKIINTVVK